jgi:hypothetical protein
MNMSRRFLLAGSFRSDSTAVTVRGWLKGGVLMTEPASLLEYQRQAATAAKVVSLPTRTKSETREDALEWGREAKALYRAGWDYKIRCGRRIWRPGHQWWFGEEIAYAMIDKRERKHV